MVCYVESTLTVCVFFGMARQALLPGQPERQACELVALFLHELVAVQHASVLVAAERKLCLIQCCKDIIL